MDFTTRSNKTTASADHRASRRWLVATSIRGMQAVGPCRRMPRGSRVTAETCKTVRAYYHIVLRFALAVIALCVLHVGEQTVVSWSHAVSSSPHAAGRELLASHGGGDSHDFLLACKVFQDEAAMSDLRLFPATYSLGNISIRRNKHMLSLHKFLTNRVLFFQKQWGDLS